MSKVAIQGNASGTGVLTIAAPNTNTDRVLNLPDNSGTLLSNASTAGFPAGSVLQVVTSTPLSTDVTTTTNAQLWAKTVTPKSSSSVFYVFSSWNTRNTGAINGFINGTIVNNASGRGTTGSGMLQNYSDHNQQSFHWAYTNSGLSDIVFSERLQQAGADATAEVWNYGYMFSIIIEVAA